MRRKPQVPEMPSHFLYRHIRLGGNLVRRRLARVEPLYGFEDERTIRITDAGAARSRLGSARGMRLRAMRATLR